MKSTTHIIRFDAHGTDWNNEQVLEFAKSYMKKEKKIYSVTLGKSLYPELHVSFNFIDFKDGNKIYRRIIFKCMKEMEKSHNIKIVGQTSTPSDYAD